MRVIKKVDRRKEINNYNNYNVIMTRILTILQKYIHIKLKKLDNSNSANLQIAWANLDGPHLYLY